MKPDVAKNRKKEEKPDLIIDGDARPDQISEESPAEAKKIKNKDKGKFTANRQGDVNSLENYKDEK